VTACAALFALQIGVAKDIIAKDGFGALYRGLSAGLLRQATYTTARLGIFQQITDYAKKANNGQNLPLWQKAACGLTAGGLGALVGTPADLTLIRMQVSALLQLCGVHRAGRMWHSLRGESACLRAPLRSSTAASLLCRMDRVMHAVLDCPQPCADKGLLLADCTAACAAG
jgi:hypothetical protein